MMEKERKEDGEGMKGKKSNGCNYKMEKERKQKGWATDEGKGD